MNRSSFDCAWRNFVSLLHLLLIEKSYQSFLWKAKVEKPGEGFLHIGSNCVFYLRRNLVSLLLLLLIEKSHQSFFGKAKVERPGEGFLHIGFNCAFYLRRNWVSLLHLLLIEKSHQSFLGKSKVERPGEGFHINPAIVYENLVEFVVGIRGRGGGGTHCKVENRKIR